MAERCKRQKESGAEQEDSVTRFLEHIAGLWRRDGKPCKQCVGQVPLEVRNQLRDYIQSAVEFNNVHSVEFNYFLGATKPRASGCPQ